MKTTTLLICISGMALHSLFAQSSIPTGSYDARPKISVSGEAIVKVRPDQIVISLGVESSDTNITAAKTKTSDVVNATIASFKALGVKEKNIQTDYLSIEPRYKSDYRHEGFLGYFVRNNLVVTIDDPSKVEVIVGSAMESGMNYIDGVDFQTVELRKYRDQARELALKAAREKANAMAATLGQKVGSPIQITENQSPWWYYSSWSGWGYGRRDGMSQNTVQNAPSAAGESDSIALGQISVRANVNVTFELKE